MWPTKPRSKPLRANIRYAAASFSSPCRLCSSNDFEFYLVGGAVRDGILGIPTSDFDFTTNASPDESIKLLNSSGYKTTEVGKAFGTIELQIENNSLHITTYREDTYEKASRNPSTE